MKKLSQYIIEKFKISKDITIKSDSDILFEYLTGGDEGKPKVKDELFKLYKSDCDNVVPKYILDVIDTTNFKLLFTIAAILHTNGFTGENGILSIKRYNSMDEVDMFNFDWLTEEFDGDMCIDLLINLYKTDKKFKQMFTKVFKIESENLGCWPDIFYTKEDLLKLANENEEN